MSVSAEEINAMLDTFWPSARIRCASVGSTWGEAKLEVAPNDLRPGGFVAGPIQFACADAAFWFMVAGALGRVEPMAMTSELSIRYLRPASGESVCARAELVRLGRSTVVANVSVWSGDPERPTAVAQGTYTLPVSSSRA